VKRIVLGLLALLLITGEAGGAPDKVFVCHLNGAPEGLDPVKCINQRCLRVMWAIYEPLVNLSKDSRTIVPGLAESWEVSPDAHVYTMKLRRGVKFHDGTPFNAAAAKANLERNFVKTSAFYTAAPPNVREEMLSGLIRSIAVEDDHTLTLTLKSNKPHVLSLIGMVSPDALARRGASIGDHPVGTGPFKFVRRAGDEIRLAANRDYWGGRPLLDEISFKIITQSDRTMQEFLAGRLHFIPEIEPLFLERIIVNPSAKLLRIPTLSTYYLGFRTDRAPFTDVRIRRALTAALDVDRTILFASRGMAVPAFGPIPPGADAYDPGIKRARYNPELARQLLKEAQVGELRLSLVVNADIGLLAELAQAIKADLGKVGVAVDLLPAAGWSELISDVRRGRGDLFIYARISLFTDPEPFLVGLFQTHAVENLSRYSNPRVDALLEQARGPVDAGARTDLYRRAQRMIVEDAPMVFLYHEVRVSAYDTRVHGLDLNVLSLPIDRFARIDLRTN
jgi:peptide/nickel transport system substrate-binding protein